jgi:hypothetical protein
MDINGWLTVITVFAAIFAFLPKEDLEIVIRKTYLIEKVLVIFASLILIPYLIYFPQLIQRFKSLNQFTISNGLDTANIAFIVFLLTFSWFCIRLSIFKPYKKPTTETIRYYQELLNEKTFDDFFRIFTKHTSPKEIKEHWDLYREIFFQQKFLNGIFNNRTKYLLQFWEQLSTEQDFKIIFRLFLENENSDYYNEIKEHWNSNALIEEMPFLNKVLKINVQDSIDNRIIDIISDYVQTHLTSEESALRLYNQKHYYPRIREDYGMNLPIYYHIRFIGFLHTSIIKNRIHTGGRMLSIYSTMVQEMINNMIVPPEVRNNEYPTNYHWLIGEIGNVTDTWVNLFGEEYYDSNSSYNQYIPFSFWLTIECLIVGFDRGVISQNFLNSMMYYHMLSSYFDHSLNEEFKGYIEEELIARIPSNHLEPILHFALNEKFAISYHRFLTASFGLFDGQEIAMVKRLHDYLRGIEKI